MVITNDAALDILLILALIYNIFTVYEEAWNYQVTNNTQLHPTVYDNLVLTAMVSVDLLHRQTVKSKFLEYTDMHSC